MPWSVAGLTRATARVVPLVDTRPVYGGTPSDAAVIEAILSLKAVGQEVMFYPFILMDQIEGNMLLDPYSGAQSQPAFPWRGRITTSKAVGQEGSPDGTQVAADEVAAFFGTAKASDFVVSSVQPVAQPNRTPSDALDLLSFSGAVKRSPVTYRGPDE